jgi:hypothetical protein
MISVGRSEENRGYAPKNLLMGVGCTNKKRREVRWDECTLLPRGMGLHRVHMLTQLCLLTTRQCPFFRSSHAAITGGPRRLPACVLAIHWSCLLTCLHPDEPHTCLSHHVHTGLLALPPPALTICSPLHPCLCITCARVPARCCTCNHLVFCLQHMQCVTTAKLHAHSVQQHGPARLTLLLLLLVLVRPILEVDPCKTRLLEPHRQNLTRFKMALQNQGDLTLEFAELASMIGKELLEDLGCRPVVSALNEYCVVKQHIHLFMIS